MQTDQLTNERVMPAAIEGTTLSEQVTAAEQVADLIKHPGFDLLAEVISEHREAILNMRVLRKPDIEAAPYADAIGHTRGLGEFVPLALGMVENGKYAAQKLRENEEGS